MNNRKKIYYVKKIDFKISLLFIYVFFLNKCFLSITKTGTKFFDIFYKEIVSMVNWWIFFSLYWMKSFLFIFMTTRMEHIWRENRLKDKFIIIFPLFLEWKVSLLNNFKDWNRVNNDLYEKRVKVKNFYLHERRCVYIWEESCDFGDFIILLYISLNLIYYSINNHCN